MQVLGKDPGFRCAGEVTPHSILPFPQASHLFSLEALKCRSLGHWVHETSNVSLTACLLGLPMCHLFTDHSDLQLLLWVWALGDFSYFLLDVTMHLKCQLYFVHHFWVFCKRIVFRASNPLHGLMQMFSTIRSFQVFWSLVFFLRVLLRYKSHTI